MHMQGEYMVDKLEATFMQHYNLNWNLHVGAWLTAASEVVVVV